MTTTPPPPDQWQHVGTENNGRLLRYTPVHERKAGYFDGLTATLRMLYRPATGRYTVIYSGSPVTHGSGANGYPTVADAIELIKANRRGKQS